MIRKLKKQSSDYHVLLVSILFVTILCLFVYATLFNTQFFNFLALSLLCSLISLVFLRARLVKKQASLDLDRQDLLENANLLEAEISREKEIINSFRRKIVNFSYLKDITEKLSLSLSLGDTSKTLSSEVSRLFGQKDITTILYLFHSKTGELGLSSSQKGQMQVNIKSKKGDIFDQWVVKTMQPFLIEDTQSDFRFDMEKLVTEEPRDVRSLMSVPLVIGNKALGILRIDSPQENSFNTEDLRLLVTIGDLGAVAIENAQLYERVEDLAIRDGLTELYLRRHFLERMSQEMSRELRRKKELSLLMIDLDNFKKYNDEFGHVAGDIVLRSVAMILANHFNDPGQIVCRYGGEEFAILLSDCPKQEALKSAEEVRKKIENQKIMLRRKSTNITVSIGIASFPKDAQLKDELIHRADSALYEAKDKGRNRVVVYK